MALELFDGSDSENDDISKIKINKEYARRFEHNKKREDLQRFEELKKKGVIDSPSPSQSEDEEESESVSSEDDDHENLFSSRSDKEFFDALLKVKKQDPILKQKDVKLFVSDDSSDDGSDEKEKVKSKDKKGEKPMYLKDVMAKHLIEEGPDFGDKEEEIDEKEKHKLEISKGKKVMPAKDRDFVNKDGKKTYGDEQEELKRAFLKAVEKEGLEDGEGEFFSVKDKVGDEDKVDSDDKEFEEKLDEYFGGDVELNESSKFLRSYFMNKMWIDKSGGNLNVGEEELQDISEDEMEIERQEEYEYRFQENHGDRVLGHARKVEGSVRKKTNPRKEQRKSKEERLAIAQKEREEELKHLKNLKKQEIQEKVKKIMETAGILDDDIIPLSVAEIEEEFDPKEYDRMMKAAFDDKYYNAEDADPDFCSDDDDIEKPDFEKEDELLGLPKGWDASGSNDGFLAAREKALKEKIESASDDDLLDREDQNEEKIPVEGSRKRKRKTALLEKARQAMMDEYYKLDYEDTIGDLKTRFKYAKTKPNRFGMNASEILLMDDKELNQYVALKKLAPYREEEWKLSKQKRYMLKTRTKELLRAASLDKKKRKKSRVDSGKTTSSNNVVENEKASAEDSNINTDKLSRTAKRRRQMATLKLSQSRLKAYGKIPTKSKHGGKH
ncbi:protein KRI1 homolog isoform X1 [Abrus precatorius]|uniref:Protein KRI1 homolog isoform X1 n=1 Tax=Abrus precatorius TaxID=3816 RepID=A0A8B8LNW5_ABRPR|nr:protein KRI1 homolog isoform X1 [Abrus precatorius]